MTLLLNKQCYDQFQTGENLDVIIEARDDQGNLITSSTSEVFTLDFTDSSSTTTSYTAVSIGGG